MGTTNFPHGVTSWGIPAIGAMPWPVGGATLATGPGKAYWCDPTNGIDSNDGLSPEQPKATLSSVHSSMTANQNDTVYIIGNSSASSTTTVRETATLTWSKNLCHIVGVNAFNRISHRVSIRPVTNDFTPLITVSADGCVFANFHVFDDSTSASQITWNLTGQRNSHFNLHIGGMGNQTAADGAGSRCVLITGNNGENYFKDCTLGLDTTNRGAANATLELITQSPRNVFEDCMFIMHADTTTPVHLDLEDSLQMDRFILFKNCMFTNAGTFTGFSTPVEVMNVNTSPGGVIILMGSHFAGFDAWEDVASTRVYVENALGAGTTGLMLAATT